MLTIINDPHGITGRQAHAWDYSDSVQTNIQRHMPGGGAGCSVLLNGEPIDAATHPALDLPPSDGMSLTIVKRPNGFDPITIALVIAAVYVGATLLAPKIPSFDPASAGKDSPNNRLTAQSNQARAYQAIPDVYGYRRVWPDMIQPSVVEYIDHIKHVTEWLCVSRGKGDISTVQYADTPLSDISSASYSIFQPTPGYDGYHESGTTTLTDVIEAFEFPDVNGQELDYPVHFATISATGSFTALSSSATFSVTIPDGPYINDLKGLSPSGTANVSFSYFSTSSGSNVNFNQTCVVSSHSSGGGNTTFSFTGLIWGPNESSSGIAFTITPSGYSYNTVGTFVTPLTCDRLRWNTIFQRGLKGSVQIRTTWVAVDGAGTDIPGTTQTQTDTYSSDTFDARYFTTNVTPAAGQNKYKIKFERLTPQIGDQGTDVAKLEEVYAVRYYATKTLPGVTVIRLTTVATEQATGYSERKFNLRWQRHVRQLGAGPISASRNFARAMAHIWALSGGAASELDVDTLQAINDALGEDSPLLRFDMSIDDADMSLGERLQLVATHARCRVWRDGTRWTVTRDEAQSVPWMQLDYRTLAAGGDGAMSYSAHLPATHDGVELEYVREDTQASKAYVRLTVSGGVVAAGTPVKPQKIQLPGCTTAAQALNRAHLEARRMLHSRVSVRDTAIGDAAHIGLGRLVRWIDPADWDGSDDSVQAGEVLVMSGLVIRTSEPIAWGGAAVGRVLFTGADGRPLGSAVMCYPDASGVRLASVPAGLYVADGVASQLGSRYALTTSLTAAELESAGLYTIEEISPAGSDSVSLSLIQYDARIYEYDSL